MFRKPINDKVKTLIGGGPTVGTLDLALVQFTMKEKAIDVKSCHTTNIDTRDYFMFLFKCII